jgi:hypothetical protein
MKTLFFMGRNEKNKSGVSWKIWKISRKGRRVITHWGAARIVGRKVRAVGRMQSNIRRTPAFTSVSEASAYMKRRILTKLRKGYEVTPRGRRP